MTAQGVTRYNTRLIEVLKKYIPNDDAVMATLALVNVIRTTRDVMITVDKPLPDEVRMNVLQMLVDLALQLPGNRWYAQNAGPLSVAFRMGAQGFLDSSKLMQREQTLPANVDRTSVRVRVLAVANLWREIPIITMALVRNGEDLSDLTVELREELAALDEPRK